MAGLLETWPDAEGHGVFSASCAACNLGGNSCSFGGDDWGTFVGK